MIDKNRLLGLEIIRFMAAFTILFVHYHHFSNIGINQAFEGASFPFSTSLAFLYFLGNWAVRVFWCISGFVFFYKYHALIASRMLDFRTFFVSRFARLYPLHYLTLLIVAIGQAVYLHMNGFYFISNNKNSVHDFILQLFMAGNRAFNQDSFNWPVWSVSIEVVVYIIFFMVTRYITKSIRFNLFVVLVFVIIRLVNWQTPLIDFFECLLFFYLGGMAAMLKNYSIRMHFPSQRVWMAVFLIPLFFQLVGGFSSFNTTLLFWAIWLPILLYCASDDFKVNPLVRKMIETLGNMTYSTYLLHFPVQLLIAILCCHWMIKLPVYNPLFLIAYLSLMLFLAYFTYRYFEVPMKKMIKAAARVKDIP